MLYSWQARFVCGKAELWVRGVFWHFSAKDAETEAQIIRDSIGFEEYARAKGVDLAKWKFEGVYLVTTSKL